MFSSRDINALRPDVAANAHKLVEIAKAQGYDVLVTDTVRDEEYQINAYNNGYSKSKVPTFHSTKARLAFDVCKNVKGHEYDDDAFFTAVGKIGKQIGFSWGGDWKSFPDRPHFQWDAYGAYKDKDILNGDYPIEMPLYGERTMNILTIGSKGDAVKALQTMLKSCGYTDANGNTLDIDGDYGEKTEFAWRSYIAAWVKII